MNPTLFDGTLVTSNRIIYTPTDFAKANLIHLQEAGELTARKPHTSRRKSLSSYLFFLVMDGEGLLEYEGRTYNLKPGDAVFVDCHRSYAHTCYEKLWRLKWVHFYGPNLNGIYNKYVESGGKCVFGVGKASRFENLLDQIYEIAASDAYNKDMRICEKLTSLLTCLTDLNSDFGEEGAKLSGRGEGKKQNLQKVKEYLDANYASKITLDELADRFYINKYYLTRIFKEQFGESVTGYLLQVRITRAKIGLRFTDKPIEEIAHECGMHDANYFARSFKKVEGVTPGEYRRMW